MPPNPEVDLLRQAQAGDMDAFAELQVRLEAPLKRFAWRLLGMHDALDDIVQDSMIALYVNLGRIDPPQHLRAYAFRIVRNRCWDELRRQRRQRLTSLDEVLDDEPGAALPEPAADEPPPDETVHSLLLYMQVQQAIDHLPEAQRQALILFALEGLRYEEIAEVMGCSLGTVKSRLFHAKRGLRAALPPEILEAVEHLTSG